MDETTSFQNLLRKLQEPFPSEIVQHRKINGRNSSYIGTDAYVERLNDIAGEYWNWTLKGEPTVYEKEIMVIGTLDIMGAKRDGIGTADLKYKGDSFTNLKYAARSASQDALRDACDLFGMGWKNLKTISVDRQGAKQDVQEETPLCQKCRQPISVIQQKWLQDNNIRLLFCENCVPDHFKK
ncbi:hypothetical protein [Salibacterium aidingense]|uniref:hypothetical protein n=1 Tax=Salibacterium aidingense TaxID=384933 RepID=UPI00041D3BB6|nr:hypothetical protein [Salibacterium aidingense]